MLIFGHVGLTAAAVHRLDRKADLRYVAVAALLPDIIDKSVFLLAPEFANGWTRLAGHSLTGLAVFTAVIAAVAGSRRALPLVLGYAMHLGLDAMWLEPAAIGLWPWLGVHPPPALELTLPERFLEPALVYGEILGLGALAWLAARGRPWCRTRLRAFAASGLLRHQHALRSGQPAVEPQ